MKFLVVFSAVVACALAKPGILAPAPFVYSAPAAVAALFAVATHAVAAPVSVHTQYHAQNEIGQASYGDAEPLQAHNAVQDAHGNKVGSFSYVSPEGHVFKTDYVADALGYRVGSNAVVGAPAAVVHRVRRQIIAAPAAYAAPATRPGVPTGMNQRTPHPGLQSITASTKSSTLPSSSSYD
ncbi:Cuticle protein 7 [Blattella germanica]|nr:Cuticle protein 7 [Blattella germanica]